MEGRELESTQGFKGMESVYEETLGGKEFGSKLILEGWEFALEGKELGSEEWKLTT